MIRMLLFFLMGQVIIISLGSCNKNLPHPSPVIARTIQFELATDKKFSADEGGIQFTLFIQDSGNNRLHWDSVLPPMQLKDIPRSPFALKIQKKVAGDDTLTLTAGFWYKLGNNSYSGWLDTMHAATRFKIVHFNFQ